MLSLSSSLHYYLYLPPTDMRKGFNGLCGLVRNSLARDPMCGDAFIFINRPRTKLKLLLWDRTGYLIYYKQLEKGTFELPLSPTSSNEYVISWEKLILILEGICLSSVKQRKRYKK